MPPLTEKKFLYKAINKTKEIMQYMEALALHTGAQKLYLEENTSCIYVVEAKRVTPRIIRINITVCFILE